MSTHMHLQLQEICQDNTRCVTQGFCNSRAEIDKIDKTNLIVSGNEVSFQKIFIFFKKNYTQLPEFITCLFCLATLTKVFSLMTLC